MFRFFLTFINNKKKLNRYTLIKSPIGIMMVMAHILDNMNNLIYNCCRFMWISYHYNNKLDTNINFKSTYYN